MRIVNGFFLYRNPNFLYDGSWVAYEPRRHWYMNFNYSTNEDWKIPGTIARDYRYQDVAFWNEYIPALVNYMTTTFSPENVAYRNEIIVFKWITGVNVLIIALLIVLAGTFGYMVWGNHEEEEGLKVETRQLVELHEHQTSMSDATMSSRTRSRISNV